jgi:L-alanine-DL-glutamate epimerase-like enolase superfamily enzyme
MNWIGLDWIGATSFGSTARKPKQGVYRLALFFSVQLVQMPATSAIDLGSWHRMHHMTRDYCRERSAAPSISAFGTALWDIAGKFY